VANFIITDDFFNLYA
jgi:hypothetical protein